MSDPEASAPPKAAKPRKPRAVEAPGPAPTPAAPQVRKARTTAKAAPRSAPRIAKRPAAPPPLRHYALAEAVEIFIRDALKLLTPKPVKDWRRKLVVRWGRERDQFRNKTPATQKLYGSRFRAPLRRALEEAGVAPQILEAVFEEVRIEREMVAAVNEDYRQTVDGSNRHLARVSGWREILAELTRMLDSTDARFLALGLMGLTGRRFVEVLKFGDFAPVDSALPSGVRVRQKWLVEFSGQAKTRGAEGTMFGKSYVIPVLAPAARILDAFARLRADREGARWAEMTPAKLNSAVNPPFNKLLREYPPIAMRWPPHPTLTLKALRAFYAEACMEAFAPPMTKAPYFARILGHAETQYETALSYMTLSLNEQGASAGMEEIHRLLMERDEAREEGIKAKAEREAAEEAQRLAKAEALAAKRARRAARLALKPPS
ncbi:protelomerase family protein [Neomegalonema perideroedes]|uniref:protelomerase family protein n=1 Tax=Neomegalonema perideroedes TaxID=217219 RepID=UPI0003604A7B|nr:protelomerase family protein [Neomegalonema perideroedes]